MVYLRDKESCSHSDHMCQSDFVTFLLLKPLIEEDPDEAETKTGAAASRKSSTPGCWTAAKVTLRLLFCLTRWKIRSLSNHEDAEDNVDSKIN